MGAIPAVGDHTDEILRGLGYDHEQVVMLHKQGVV
jgi:crotonobetainyl-CoA:carnitine CoA-transferase CaiB-like acyl-CoA transferase